MKTDGKISQPQLYALLSVSRLLSTLTFVPSFGFKAGVSDYIISSVIGSVMLWLSCLPIMRLKSGETVVGRIENDRLKKSVLILYAAYLVFLADFTLLRLKTFVSSVFFNSSDTAFFTVLTLAAVCYCASFGLEAIARAGSVSLFLLCVSLTVIFVSLSENLDANNLSPVFYYGVSPVMKLSLAVMSRSSEPALIYLLADRVRGGVRKGFTLWISAVNSVITLAGLFLMMSLSDTALMQAFPFHAMSELSTFSVIERMDSVFSAIWIMSAFIKAVLLIFTSKELISERLPEIKQKHLLTAMGIILSVLLLIEESSLRITALVTSIQLREALFAVFVVIIPSLALIKTGRRKLKL